MDLTSLSVEQLGDIQVTSVSKRAEPIEQAASSIYVITHDDIARSGAESLPEILRLAPNLEVAQASASGYVITARGFNGAPAAQNFSNKLLVLIDGRTVYTPLFSGVYWDMQDVLPQDIERIEVISGPGATLWGSNAVNGVINIITRKSGDTQGGLADLSGGNQQRTLSLRYGGKIGDSLTYRAYVRSVYDADTEGSTGASLHDHWSSPQGGFRFDWAASGQDNVTLQGDAYGGEEAQLGAPAEDIHGDNLTARWTRTLGPDSSLQVQTYYDHAQRSAQVDGSGFVVDTYDIDLQHNFSIGDRNSIVWGGGYRAYGYRIDGTSTLLWSPPARTLTLANLFAQDSFSLTAATKLIVGLKLEDDPYVGLQVLPDVRLSWSPGAMATVWGAVSRAVRAPTPFDRDVVEKSGGAVFLTGSPNFQPETLTAYELGTKLQPSSHLSLSVSAYYNVYDDLRSIELASRGFLPLHWGNLMQGDTYGVEAWGDYQAAPWWKLSGGLNYLEEKFRFSPGATASALVGLTQAANDPKYQASLRSSMDLGRVLTLDETLRYVSALPDPRVPAYVEMDARLAWKLSEHLLLAISGRNLLHDRHLEYVGGSYIPRSAFADLQWRF